MFKFDTTLNRLRSVGILEAISFLLLLGVAMPLKYAFGQPEMVRIVGMAHGVLWMLYVGLAALGQIDYKWPLKRRLCCSLPACCHSAPSWLMPSCSRKSSSPSGASTAMITAIATKPASPLAWAACWRALPQLCRWRPNSGANSSKKCLGIELRGRTLCGAHTTTGLRACFFCAQKSSQLTFGVIPKLLIYNNFFLLKLLQNTL